MELYVSDEGRYRFLMVDAAERVAELPSRFLQWLARPKCTFAPLTLDRYAQRLTGFLDFFEINLPDGVTVDQALQALELGDVDDFYSDLQEEGKAASTVRGYEVAVKRFADWLTTKDAGRLHDISIYDGVGWRTNHGERLVPRYVLVPTVLKLLKAMHIEEHRLAGHLMYDAGLRSSEVARAKAIDLPNPDEYPSETDYFPLFVRGSKGPGGAIKQRYTVISRPTLARINRYHNTPEYKFNARWAPKHKPLLLNSDGNEWTPKAIQKSIADAHKRSGLVEKVGGHKLRHGMAVSVLASNMGETLLDNLLMLQKLLGHNQLGTTEKYTTIPVAVLQQIRKANHELGRSRIDDAEQIFRETYLPRRRHASNSRGPKKTKPQ